MFREFAASRAGLASAIDHVQEICKTQGAGSEIANPLCVILDEMIGNLMTHGRVGAEQVFGVQLAAHPGGAQMVIRDAGPPFDPLNWPPDERAKIGGHGIALTKGLAQDLSYTRDGPFNLLTANVSSTS
ncbi:MAG: ATP-binding protein [Pseudomonadota bacterium]